jgi:hypothetical protein
MGGGPSSPSPTGSSADIDAEAEAAAEANAAATGEGDLEPFSFLARCLRMLSSRRTSADEKVKWDAADTDKERKSARQRFAQPHSHSHSHSHPHPPTARTRLLEHLACLIPARLPPIHAPRPPPPSAGHGVHAALHHASLAVHRLHAADVDLLLTFASAAGHTATSDGPSLSLSLSLSLHTHVRRPRPSVAVIRTLDLQDRHSVADLEVIERGGRAPERALGRALSR